MGNRFGMYARVAAMAIVLAGAGWAGSAFAELVIRKIPNTAYGPVRDTLTGQEWEAEVNHGPVPGAGSGKVRS